MDTKDLILKQVKRQKKIKVADIVKATGFSRAYVNRSFHELRDEGKIILIGQTNQAHYIMAEKRAVLAAKKSLLAMRKVVKNINLAEDTILDEIKRESGIFLDLKKNVSSILDYAFTEILNNAIEHSKSKTIEIKMKRSLSNIRFDIIDHGIGIFNNIMQKKHLKNELEAIQDLLKGKQTTMPKEHSGEGIFFTSKVADNLVIESSKKKLMFNNIINDIFIHNINNIIGTKVIFTISIDSPRKLEKIFRQYSGESYEFSKTNVAVKLYKINTVYMSRSQARRIMSGLGKFKTIILDFTRVETVGQAFADEIFRVWQNHRPKIKIMPQNMNENVNFMIQRAIK